MLKALCITLLALFTANTAVAQDLLGVTFSGDVYEIDSVTGESVSLGNCGFPFIGSLTRTQSGDVYAISRPGNVSNQLIRIDSLGNGTLIGQVNVGSPIQSLAYDELSGRLFALTASELYKIEPATGSAGLVGPTPITLPDAATFEPGGALYVWESSNAPGARGLYEMDKGSGDVLQISTSNNALQWLSHDSNGVLIGGGGPEAIFVIDSNGNLRFDSDHSAAGVLNATFLVDRASFTQACSGSGGVTGTCTDCPCGNNVSFLTMTGCRHSEGEGARLLVRGTPSVAAGDLRFELTGAKSNSFGLLLSGASIAPTSPLNPCFGENSGIQSPTLDGLRCAVQDLRRHGTRMIDGNGQTGFQNGGWGPPSPPLNGIASEFGFGRGQTRHFQVFFRDVAHGSCTLEANTTQVVSVTFTP